METKLTKKLPNAQSSNELQNNVLWLCVFFFITLASFSSLNNINTILNVNMCWQVLWDGVFFDGWIASGFILRVALNWQVSSENDDFNVDSLTFALHFLQVHSASQTLLAS